ncbi:TLDc domain-containing protein [Entamoeba marina]
MGCTTSSFFSPFDYFKCYLNKSNLVVLFDSDKDHMSLREIEVKVNGHQNVMVMLFIEDKMIGAFQPQPLQIKNMSFLWDWNNDTNSFFFNTTKKKPNVIISREYSVNINPFERIISIAFGKLNVSFDVDSDGVIDTSITIKSHKKTYLNDIERLVIVEWQ